MVFNLRFSPYWTAAKLEAGIETRFERHRLDFNVSGHRSGEPFFTPEGRLRSTAREVLSIFAGGEPEESNGGGTSDARFIAPPGEQCIEVGPVNASLHKVDETVRVRSEKRRVGKECVSTWRAGGRRENKKKKTNK